MLPRWMPSGEDTRLYNYGVPVIGRSKLRFPAPREQEYAARARDGRHCEKYEDSPGMRGQFSLFHQFSLFRSDVEVAHPIVPARVSELRYHRLARLVFRLTRATLLHPERDFREVRRFKFEETFFFGACRLSSLVFALPDVKRRRFRTFFLLVLTACDSL